MGNAKPFLPHALEVPRTSLREESRGERARRAEKKRETSFLGETGREPERSESSGEQTAPTRTKPSGSNEERGYLGGSKPLRHR